MFVLLVSFNSMFHVLFFSTGGVEIRFKQKKNKEKLKNNEKSQKH